MTRSRSIDRLRWQKRNREEAREPREIDTPLWREAPEEPSASLGREEEHGRLVEALALLPALQRTAIEQSFFLGLSHTEIAHKEGVPLGTVKSWIRRGLARLGESLKEREVTT